MSSDGRHGSDRRKVGVDAPAAPAPHGRHERARSAPTSRRGRLVAAVGAGVPRRGFGVAAVLLCLLLGVAIATGVRYNESGDALDDARPADLVVLLDSLQQREAALTADIADLRQTLTALQDSGSDDRAALADAQAQLTALSVLTGTEPATGPGVTVTIDDPAGGVAPETMLDVVNELRAAGAEAIEIRSPPRAVRVGVDTAMTGSAGALVIDDQPLAAPYSVVAIGDPPTLAAALTIPGGASDSVGRVGGEMTIEQSARVDITALRQQKPRQYAQPVR